MNIQKPLDFLLKIYYTMYVNKNKTKWFKDEYDMADFFNEIVETFEKFYKKREDGDSYWTLLEKGKRLSIFTMEQPFLILKDLKR